MRDGLRSAFGLAAATLARRVEEGSLSAVEITAAAPGEGPGALVAARARGHAVRVVRAGHLPEDRLRAARDSLIGAGAEVAGVILNARREVVPRWLAGLLH
jgi:Mrp family chromosome partitioning ATPase